VKVPIEDVDGGMYEYDEQAADGAAAQIDLDNLSPEEEEALIEAAKRAGAAAAEEDIAREEDARREQVGDLLLQLDEQSQALEAAQKEAADATERMMRLQADWENFRRRTRQEREQERERAAERLVVGLLPVLDDMERAIDHARGTEGADNGLLQFADGVQQVHDKMIQILGREGVEVIDALGQPFEPISHQAVGRVEDAEAFDETVAQVYQQGYRMGGKVIRPAMVTVTFGGPKRPVDEDDSESSE
jgi:molecular chaperone GrpE